MGTYWLRPEDKVNNQTVASAVTLFWDALGIPRAVVRLTLVDNAGYCKKAFDDHLTVVFPNAVLRRCWAHSANRSGATIFEHPLMAALKEYMRLMRALVHAMNQCQRRHRYVADIGKVLLDYTDTRWTSESVTAEHHAQKFNDECVWLEHEVALRKDHKILLQVTTLVTKKAKAYE